MKKLKIMSLVSALISVFVLGLFVGCNTEEAPENGFSVNVKGEVPNEISVQLVSIDGSIKSERSLKNGKAFFDVETNAIYIVNLVGFTEEYNFPLLTVGPKETSVTIQVQKSKTVEGNRYYSYSVFIFDENNAPIKVSPYSAQMCSDGSCFVSVTEQDSSILSFNVKSGDYHFTLNAEGYANVDANYSVAENRRFSIVMLNKI